MPLRAADDDGTGDGTPIGGGILASPMARVNFQPQLTTIPTGFFADKGKIFGLRTNGNSYGWLTAPRTDAVARHEHPLPQYDTFNQMWKDNEGTKGKWEFALLNGSYPVVVVMGDCASLEQVNDISIEGIDQIDPDPFDPAGDGYNRGDFDGYAAVVTVSDGKLTIVASPTAKNPKLCWLEIGKLGTSIDQATVNRLELAIEDASERTSGLLFPAPKPNPRQYVYGDDYIDHPLMFVSGGQKYYYLTNHLYSVSTLAE